MPYSNRTKYFYCYPDGTEFSSPCPPEQMQWCVKFVGASLMYSSLEEAQEAYAYWVAREPDAILCSITFLRQEEVNVWSPPH